MEADASELEVGRLLDESAVWLSNGRPGFLNSAKTLRWTRVFDLPDQTLPTHWAVVVVSSCYIVTHTHITHVARAHVYATGQFGAHARLLYAFHTRTRTRFAHATFTALVGSGTFKRV